MRTNIKRPNAIGEREEALGYRPAAKAFREFWPAFLTLPCARAWGNDAMTRSLLAAGNLATRFSLCDLVVDVFDLAGIERADPVLN